MSTPTSATVPVVSARVPVATLLLWLRRMIEIRAFEERVQELFLEGLIEGTTHLCQGQEGVSVGAVAALRAEDYLTITYRGHGHALARGMDPRVAFAELMGRADGCCKGLGGSMHLTDFSRNLIGSFAIVGASYPVALGAAMSAKLRGKASVAMAFCGDGATNIGTFHETLNMAAVWKAPAVFVIENNLYGEYSPLGETTAVLDLKERAVAHGIEGVAVDGQDAEAVHAVCAAAVEKARGGDGPTLVEAKTYRYRGHSRTDPAKYRPADELAAWKDRDPIGILAARLEAAGALDSAGFAALDKEVRLATDDASKRASDSGVLSYAEVQRYVYSD